MPIRDDELQRLKKLYSVPQRIPASAGQIDILERGHRHTHRDGPLSLECWTFGHGRRVVLAHGWNSRGSHLAHWVEPLLGAGFSVTLYDAPAHGTSPGEASSVIHMGRALLSLCQAIQPVYAVIGHSAGSAAILWALNNGLSLDASVHLGGPASLGPMLRSFLRTQQASPELAVAFMEWVETFIGQPISEANLGNLRHGLLHPALIIHDLDDPVVPYADADALHRNWPFSEIIQVRELGNSRILRDPAVMRRAVEFVWEHAGGPMA
ncbi:alpha/beta fold hydrolase [Pseudomonas sp. SZMC_28357]|uniref:alpha/beta hydrolase n=1 Tax=Pseudomonas sp. SZMC_28357 TaxID=3074380 RepID=UPI0028724923|nr:alpha/beta fold hydrolase [Pseudomonas sp. SZMC_28357]MDR9751350.1 alpha/beta fold hydrolase [Pseudomonas sp. SZMC_28357]